MSNLIEGAKAFALQKGLSEVTFCGRGAFKETYRVVDQNGRPVALKIVDRSKIDLERTKREIAALRKCNSPQIPSVIETASFVFAGQAFDVIIEEFFDGGSLEDRLKSFTYSVSDLLSLTRGLIKALIPLNKQKLVHRDIKPANIMFRKDSTEPVLVDFGIVRDLSESSLTATWLPSGPGTPYFAAPEQLNNEKHLIDWRTDQFSIGVMIGHLLTRMHPYQVDATNPSAAIHAVAERRGPAKAFSEAAENTELSVLVKMVAPWPVQRFLTPELLLNQL